MSFPETDFEWVPDYGYGCGYKFGTKGIGYWHYKGDSTEVVIPEKIGGHTLTNYYFMFAEYPVTKVTSTNKKVTDMSRMFKDSKATTLDLSNLDTSSVNNMSYMFYGAQASSLDLRRFDTSSVNTMESMFHNSKATTLDLSSFNIANVTNMSRMFYGAQAKSLNLKSFNTSYLNGNDMEYMFYESKATTGIARTQKDADKFNKSFGKASGLTFTAN